MAAAAAEDEPDFASAVARALHAANRDAHAVETAASEADLTEDDDGAELAEASAIPPRHAEDQQRRPRLVGVLYALAVAVVVAGVGGLGWAYRDRLPMVGPAPPELTDVRPVWHGAGESRRLMVAATVGNPGSDPREITRIRVRFLNATGAWLDETVVDLPPLMLAPGTETPVELAVRGLPEGTASLELSVMPDAPLS